MTRWISPFERAVIGEPAQFEQAAADLDIVTRRSETAIVELNSLGASGWDGFEGALADAYASLLRTVATQAEPLPLAATASRSALADAADMLRPLRERSDALATEATERFGAHSLAVTARDQARVTLSRNSRRLALLASQPNVDGELDETIRRAQRDREAAYATARDAARRVDAVEAELDAFDHEFGQLRSRRDELDDHIAARLGAVDPGRPDSNVSVFDGGAHPVSIVLDLIDAALISLGDGTTDRTRRDRLESARESLAALFGLSLDDRDHVIERERVIAHGTPEEVREFFLNVALENAGIDLDDWDPSQGLDHNSDIVDSVYEYYGDLYRGGDDHLWWAGMAALIGPSFMGGFRDLETFSDLIGAGGDIADFVSDAPIPIPGMPVFADGAELAAHATEAELRWYQELLLSMQQEIFFDMAPAHEAFNEIGMRGIEAMFADDPYGYGAETIDAWQNIADGHESGNTDLIAEGNAALLRREQEFIINDDYTRMRDSPITGEVTTYVITAVGAPSVPGTQTFPEVFPWTPEVTIYTGTPQEISPFPNIPFVDEPSFGVPHAGVETTVSVETPLPDGNIAGFEDRWALIEADTLPVYTDLAENHPEVIHEQLDRPVGERADEYELSEQWDDIAEHLITAWDLDIDVGVVVGN